MNGKPLVLLLDDSEQRHEMFRTGAWDLDIEHTYSIPGFRQSVLEQERPPEIISLDHDLEGLYHTRGSITKCGCDACDLVNQHLPSSIRMASDQ